MISELIEFGLNRYKKNYNNRYENTSFQLYQKYTYEDVCRLLEWEKGEVAFLGKIKAIGEPKEFTMKNTTKTAVEIKYQLFTPIRSDI